MTSAVTSKSLADFQKENARLKQLVKELESENAKLHKKMAKLDVENTSARNRIKALEKHKGVPEGKPLSDAEIDQRILFLLNKFGLHPDKKIVAK